MLNKIVYPVYSMQSSLLPMVLPAFDSNGNLPQGDYSPSELEFESRFVNVPLSTTRSSVYSAFQRHRADLLANNVSPFAPCLLDGSFTTSKQDPEDIDLVVEVDADLVLRSARVRE